MARKSELQIKYEAAIEAGLASESAAERTQALRSAGDLLNPNLGDLQTQVKQSQDRLDESKTSLKEAQDSLAAANAKIGELQPLADRLPAAEAELAELKSAFDARVAEMRTELVAEVQKERFKAEAALRAAEDKLREADNKVAASGWTELRKSLADLLAQHSVPMPSFWETSATMPSAFWTLWGWSPTKAKVFTAYKASYPTVSESFKQQAFRVLTAGLPTFPILQPLHLEDGDLAQPQYAPQAEIPDLGVRRECLMEMAQRFDCLREIQQRVEQRQIEIYGQHLRQNASDLQAQQIDMSMRGYGRETQEQPEQSVTGFAGECIDPANCCCPKHNGVPAHLRPYEIEESL
jgi:hypothetical protein